VAIVDRNADIRNLSTNRLFTKPQNPPRTNERPTAAIKGKLWVISVANVTETSPAIEPMLISICPDIKSKDIPTAQIPVNAQERRRTAMFPQDKKRWFCI
jgi:hypothetical protein